MKRWGFLFAESCGIVLVACSLYGQWENPDKRLTVYPSHVDYGGYNNAWTIAVRDTMVHIVWEHRNIGPGELYYIRSINSGSSFEPDTQLTTRDSHFPSVAVCDSIVHIVWQDARDGNPEIYYKRSVDDGETWGDDEMLTNDLADSEYPSVAVSDSIVHIVWQDDRWGNYEIYYKRSVDNGETWGGDERLTDALAYSGYPSVAVSDSIVHIVWYDHRDGNEEIYYNRSIDNGMLWYSDERITDDLAASYNPSIAVCDSIVHIVWYDWRDNDEEIYYNRSVNDGETWGIIDERITDAVGKSHYVSVACWDCSYDYDVHIAWTDERDGGNNEEIYYKRHKCEGSNVEEDYRFKITDLGLEVHPNPFTQRTVISYQLPEELSTNNSTGFFEQQLTTLKIYDITGRIVKTLVNKEKSAGCYDVSFDTQELTTGIYFVKLVVGDYKEIKKLILMK